MQAESFERQLLVSPVSSDEVSVHIYYSCQIAFCRMVWTAQQETRVLRHAAAPMCSSSRVLCGPSRHAGNSLPEMPVLPRFKVASPLAASLQIGACRHFATLLRTGRVLPCFWQTLHWTIAGRLHAF